MRAFTILSLLAVLGSSAAWADVMYDCKFDQRSSTNVPDQVILGVDSKAGVVVVLDPFINTYVGNPIEGTIVTDSAKKLTVTWKLENVKAKGIGSIRRISSRMTVTKGTLDASISVTQGVGDSDTGNGHCKIVK